MKWDITHLHQEVVSLTATVTAAPRTTPEVEERIATIQTAIEETTRWVDVARRAPKAAVSATIAEQEQRASKALNIRVRGIPRADPRNFSKSYTGRDIVFYTEPHQSPECPLPSISGYT